MRVFEAEIQRFVYDFAKPLFIGEYGIITSYLRATIYIADNSLLIRINK
jgi:hypothetical protein